MHIDKLTLEQVLSHRKTVLKIKRKFEKLFNLLNEDAISKDIAIISGFTPEKISLYQDMFDAALIKINEDLKEIKRID